MEVRRESGVCAESKAGARSRFVAVVCGRLFCGGICGAERVGSGSDVFGFDGVFAEVFCVVARERNDGGGTAIGIFGKFADDAGDGI